MLLIFLELLLVFSVSAKLCDEKNIVDLTNATISEKGSLISDGLIFSRDFIYTNNDTGILKTYGCLCEAKQCFRKCCPSSKIFYSTPLGNKCVEYHDIPTRNLSVPFPDSFKKRIGVEDSQDIYMLYGPPCKGNFYLEDQEWFFQKREAKENVYAILDPHIQYELTINKRGEPPKYLSLSKPLTHQRKHAFESQNINEMNYNKFIDNTFSTFKNDPKISKSNRSKRNNKNDKSYLCNSNHDVKYSIDPQFGMIRAESKEVFNAQYSRNNIRSSYNNNGRMYERNNSGRSNAVRRNEEKNGDIVKIDVKRASNRRKVKVIDVHKQEIQECEKECSFEDMAVEHKVQDSPEDDSMPKPGKVKEIASRFNRSVENLEQSVNVKVNRPKNLQSFDQAYLDHVFPDAVEI